VILLQQAKWTFYDYVQDKKNPIQAWYKDLSLGAQLQFDAVLKDCSKTENPKDWGGFRHFLQGPVKVERVWELGFVADKRQYRILGIFGDERKHAILLIGCYHKGRNYTPSNAIETARKRARGFKEGKGGLRERKIETDF
jgi:hypothetical protein